jgi:toxin ParE1/3/4
MSLPIHISLAASRDLEDITTWIAEHDSPEKAGYVLDRLIEVAESIGALPYRGSTPSELPPGLEAKFRQVFFKPYRVIYEIAEDKVIIHLIADGRRNLQSLLMRRLTSA